MEWNRWKNIVLLLVGGGDSCACCNRIPVWKQSLSLFGSTRQANKQTNKQTERHKQSTIASYTVQTLSTYHTRGSEKGGRSR